MDENKNKFIVMMKEIFKREKSMPKTGTQIIEDIVMGAALLIGSTYVVINGLNHSGLVSLLALAVTIVINGIVMVRGFRKNNAIMASFALLFLGPAIFISLAFGACSLG